MSSLALQNRNYSGRSHGDRRMSLSSLSIWLFVLSGAVREVLGQTELFNLGSYTLHVVDPAIFAATYAIIYNLTIRRFEPNFIFVLSFLMFSIVILNFFRGLATGSDSALVWFRGTAAMAALPIIALTVPIDRLEYQSLRRAIIFGGYFFSFLIMIRIPFGYKFLTIAQDTTYAMLNEGRPVSNVGAFILMLCFAINLSEALRNNEGARKIMGVMTSFLMLIFIMISGQGTIMIAAVLSAISIIAFEHGKRKDARLILVTITFSLFAAAIFAIEAFGAKFLDSESPFAAQRAINMETRQAIWSSLIDAWPRQPVFDQFFGNAAGKAPVLYVYLDSGLTSWGNSIHSMYLGSLPIMGYVGLFIFLTILLYATVRSWPYQWRLSGQSYLPASGLAACLATWFLCYTYEIRNEQALGIYWALFCIRYSTWILEDDRKNKAAW